MGLREGLWQVLCRKFWLRWTPWVCTYSIFKLPCCTLLLPCNLPAWFQKTIIYFSYCHLPHDSEEGWTLAPPEKILQVRGCILLAKAVPAGTPATPALLCNAAQRSRSLTCFSAASLLMSQNTRPLPYNLLLGSFLFECGAALLCPL